MQGQSDGVLKYELMKVSMFGREVFGPFDVRVVPCFWHVKRSWLKNLQRKCPRPVQYPMCRALGKIMLMLQVSGQFTQSFTQEAHDAMDGFYAQYADQPDFILLQ